jgi:hypothetical protein
MFPYWLKALFPKKSRPASRGRRPNRVRLGLEQLETRLVPTVFASVDSAGILQVSTDNNENVRIDHTVTVLGPTTTVTSFGPTTQRQFPDFQLTGIHIQGGFFDVAIVATSKPLTADAEENVTVGNFAGTGLGNMQNIQAPVSLTNVNHVTLDDGNGPPTQNATVNVVNEVVQVTGLAPAPISIGVFGANIFGANDLTSLNIFGGVVRDTFNVLDTPNAFRFGAQETTTTITTGFALDRVNVLGTSSKELRIVNQGNDVVSIGDGAGNLDRIQSPVNISNTLNFTQLLVDGSGARSAQNVTMSASGIHGLAPQDIGYDARGIRSVSVFGGSHGNTWTVQDTFKNDVFGRTSGGTFIETGGNSNRVNVLGTTGSLIITGQGGHDVVNVGSHLTNINGEVDVFNSGGQLTQLNVDSRGDNIPHRVTLFANGVFGDLDGLAGSQGVVPIRYGTTSVNFVTLQLGNETDQVFVAATPANVQTRIFAGPGSKLFDVNGVNNNLDTILGRLQFFGVSGGNADLEVHDENAPFGHTYQEAPNQIVRSGLGGPTVVIDFFTMQVEHLFRNRQPGAAAQDLALTEQVRVGETARLTGRLVDADPSQVLSLTVIWGDGSAPDQSTPDRDPFAVTHTYASPGVYTVHAIWSDSHGVSNSRDLTITVRPARHGDHGDHDSRTDDLDAFFAALARAEEDRHHRN